MLSNRILQISLLAVLLGLLASCTSVNYRQVTVATSPLPFPQLRMAVLSDIHVFDPSLGISGPEWEKYQNNDRKLLAQGLETFDQALIRIEAAQPQILLISGDLTKDGELHNHQVVADRLAALRQRGIRTFVIPGNHDVLNPDARVFGPDGVTAVPSVSPEEFARIHGASGYDAALMRDPHSLSYLVEAAPGLLLLGIDSCRYEENAATGRPIVAGRIDQGRADFIAAALERAKAEGKPVIAMMHHGLAEHFAGQARDFPKYVVADRERIAQVLVRGGVRLVFTGHFHANDITRAVVAAGDGPDRSLPFWDIETGSMVTWPCPYRLVDLQGTIASIQTGHIDRLPSFDAAGRDFNSYGKDYTENGLSGIAIATMLGLGAGREESSVLAPQIARALVAHYKGDEVTPEDPGLKTGRLSLIGSLIAANRGPTIEGLWRDLAPADNQVVIDVTEPE